MQNVKEHCCVLRVESLANVNKAYEFDSIQSSLRLYELPPF